MVSVLQGRSVTFMTGSVVLAQWRQANLLEQQCQNGNSLMAANIADSYTRSGAKGHIGTSRLCWDVKFIDEGRPGRHADATPHAQAEWLDAVA